MFAVFEMPKDIAQKGLWLGLMLIVLSFALKQVMVGFAMANLGTALEEPKLHAEREAALNFAEKEMLETEEIRQKYQKLLKENRGETAAAAASAIAKLQWFCYLKFLLDLARLLGCILLVFAAFKIVSDPDTGTWTKALALVYGSLGLLSITLGSILTLLV